MGAVFGGTRNSFGIKQVYPRAGTATSAVAATSTSTAGVQPIPMPSGGGAAMGAAMPANEVQEAAMVGSMGSPLSWFLVLAVALAILMFGVRKLGDPDADFKNLKPSVYNILVISFAAIIGTVFWKAVFTRVKVPGLSALVLAS